MTVSYLAQGRFSKPYLVLWNPLHQVGAWYDRRFQLKANEITSELLEFAQLHARNAHPWNDLTDIELPAWSARAPMDDCVCFWLFDDTSGSDDLARIPRG